MRELVKKFIYATLLLSLLLASWEVSYRFTCFGLVFGVMILGLVAWSMIDIAVVRKRCLVDCTFQKSSLLSKILSSHLWILLYGVMAGAILTATILSHVSRGSYHWGFLFPYILLCFVTYHLVGWLLRGTLTPVFSPLLQREWSIAILTVISLPLFVYLALEGSLPVFLVDSLEGSIQNATALTTTPCTAIAIPLQIVSQIDATLWWLVYNTTEATTSWWVKGMVWIGFILYNTIALLAINRLILQTISLVEHLSKHKESHERG